MVKQQVPATEEEEQVARRGVRDFVREHNFAEEDALGRPNGILRLTGVRDGKPVRREPYVHQVRAAQHLMSKVPSEDTPWEQRRASLLLMHEVGTGKTISAMLALAAVYKAMLALAAVDKANPDPAETKTMIIVPKSVLEAWHEHLKTWTVLGDPRIGDEGEILLALKQADVKNGDVARARVILTTVDVLKAAFKTFMTVTKEKKKGRNGKLRLLPFPQRVKCKPNKPMHPLFKPISDADEKNAKRAEGSPRWRPFALTIIDEIHLVSNPDSMKGHLVGMFSKLSAYKLGLTGTPVSSRPSQLANLARTLDLYLPGEDAPRRLQKESAFKGADGSEHAFNAAAVAKFHDAIVDRVDKEFLFPPLPPRKVVYFEYDPFVGLRPDGTINGAAITKHNEKLALAKNLVFARSGGAAPELEEVAMDADGDEAKSVASEGVEDDEPEEPEAPDNSKWGDDQRAAFSAMVAMGNFEFHPLLGIYGAAAFVETTEAGRMLFDKAAREPSQVMLLIARVIKSRQTELAGHPRVAVFCQSTTQLKILHGYLYGEDMGELFVFDGSLEPKARNDMVKDFIACPKGVLLFSGAGGIGITLCPGCEVLLSVGSLPWNATDIDQAFGRVHRIRQDKPVEIIQFVARRSVTAAKLSLHDDKRDRLQLVATDEDYSRFNDGDSAWRWTARILDACVPLNASGNYGALPSQRAALKEYRATAEWNATNGQPPPAPPPEALELTRPPVLARVAPLQPVTFPLGLVAEEKMDVDEVANAFIENEMLAMWRDGSLGMPGPAPAPVHTAGLHELASRHATPPV